MSLLNEYSFEKTAEVIISELSNSKLDAPRTGSTLGVKIAEIRIRERD